MRPFQDTIINSEVNRYRVLSDHPPLPRKRSYNVILTSRDANYKFMWPSNPVPFVDCTMLFPLLESLFLFCVRLSRGPV